jgi:hypothetical protein
MFIRIATSASEIVHSIELKTAEFDYINIEIFFGYLPCKTFPTLPANPTFKPAFFRIWYSSKVVVVLPLLPVIHIVFAVVYLPANSISEITGIPFSFS